MSMISTEALLQHYHSDHSYDESLEKDGNFRPLWKTFFQSFSGLGQEEVQNRHNDILRLLKENGVTYNIYGDPAGMNRPWKLDLIPLLISKEEWTIIESGLVQRATLLDMILKDIYGQRKLIRNGLLPMELVYHHAGFLRQCAGIPLPGKHSLVLYAADIARGADGKIWVVNDRTQAPSGSGYALENRMAMARILPELFNGLKVRRTSAWFDALRLALHEMSPGRKQDPRIVILTPGPGNETYFEHSYLSSILGYTLVQGNDLIVKDNYVWLKTMNGLEKVDVILRRVDDVYCDPLELKEDSQLGVPGLLNAVRYGHVSIANPLGSSILENPGLMPFLQGISRYFLGTNLLLPAIASWWCGQPKEMAYVMEHIRSLVIKRIYRYSTGSSSIDAASLSEKQLQELKQQIRIHPHLYVGQEKVNFSSTPSLVNGKLEPRNALFRSFLVSNNDTYAVMTGGLTRTSTGQGNFLISNQSGGISKDTWIISPEPERPQAVRDEWAPHAMAQATISQTQSMSPSTLPAAGGALPSHTAENLFWVGRYTERVLGNARFQRTVMQWVTEGNRLIAGNDIRSGLHLLQALTHYTFTYPGFAEMEESDERIHHSSKELRDTLFDEKRTGSLSCNLSLFNQAVYAVREHWSTDTWRVLRGMEEQWTAAARISNPGHLRMLGVLDSLITSMVAFIGLNRESISREQGWIMLDAGRKIEQSLLLVNMLRVTLTEQHDEQVEYDLQESVLISNESLVNYRYKYRAPLQLSLVLDLMLLDPNNPRSLIYQLERLKTYLAGLPRIQSGNTLSEHERLIWEAYTLLKLSDKDLLSRPDRIKRVYPCLEELLSKIQALLSAIPDIISKTYFKHAQTQTQLFATDNN
ncbi:MAG TPA: circularly permuted type 2 ATP-grasp protein [Puia sp.]